MKKFAYRASLIFAIFTLIISQSVAQRPPRALLGITAGGMLLPGGDGLLFDSGNKQARRTWGWAAGASLYRYLNRDLFLNINGLVMEEQSQVFSPLPNNGVRTPAPFAYRALHTSLTLNHQGSHLRRPWVLKEFAGFAFNLGNLSEEEVSTRYPEGSVRTLRTQKWQFDPEFVIGGGLVSKMTDWGSIHYSLSLHIDLLQNQEYTASLIRNGERPLGVTSLERNINVMLTATYFVRFPRRRNVCGRF